MKIFWILCVCLLATGCVDGECYRRECIKLGYTGQVHGGDYSQMKHCMDENGRGYPVFIEKCQ